MLTVGAGGGVRARAVCRAGGDILTMLLLS